MITLTEARIREIIREEIAASDFQAFLDALYPSGNHVKGVPEGDELGAHGGADAGGVGGDVVRSSNGGSHGADVFLESHDTSVEEGS